MEELQPKDTQSVTDGVVSMDNSDMSGVEIISPHAQMALAREVCTIDGIGELSTSWIGKKGVSISKI